MGDVCVVTLRSNETRSPLPHRTTANYLFNFMTNPSATCGQLATLRKLTFSLGIYAVPQNLPRSCAIRLLQCSELWTNPWRTSAADHDLVRPNQSIKPYVYHPDKRIRRRLFLVW